MLKEKAKDVKKEEIGFGISVIKALFVVDEEKGSKEIENFLNNIEEIADFSVETMTRL